MSARVQIFERFTGLFKLKHLVDDGVELGLLLTQELAEVLMIFFCACRDTSVCVTCQPICKKEERPREQDR